jgi:hypothetical protein
MMAMTSFMTCPAMGGSGEPQMRCCRLAFAHDIGKGDKD